MCVHWERELVVQKCVAHQLAGNVSRVPAFEIPELLPNQVSQVRLGIQQDTQFVPHWIPKPHAGWHSLHWIPAPGVTWDRDVCLSWKSVEIDCCTITCLIWQV